jgi:hypothetical protein
MCCAAKTSHSHTEGKHISGENTLGKAFRTIISFVTLIFRHTQQASASEDKHALSGIATMGIAPSEARDLYGLFTLSISHRLTLHSFSVLAYTNVQPINISGTFKSIRLEMLTLLGLHI